MEKIAVKTKIKLWAIAGKKQHIVFKTLDMTSRQVANLDKLIRNNKDEHIKLTISPDNESLDIPGIESAVKLISMDCTGKGQHLKVSEFRCPDNRMEQLKEYIESESEIIVTIEQTQEKLIDETPEDTHHEEHKEKEDLHPAHYKEDDDFDETDSDDNQPAKEYTVNENGVITNPEVITVKLPKNYGTMCAMSLGKSNANWYFGFDIEIGNQQKKKFVDTTFPRDVPYKDINLCKTVYEAVQAAKKEIFEFIDQKKKYVYAKQAKAKIESAVEKWLLGNGYNTQYTD